MYSFNWASFKLFWIVCKVDITYSACCSPECERMVVWYYETRHVYECVYKLTCTWVFWNSYLCSTFCLPLCFVRARDYPYQHFRMMKTDKQTTLVEGVFFVYTYTSTPTVYRYCMTYCRSIETFIQIQYIGMASIRMDR